VLGLEGHQQINIDADFFDLGGNSILAMQLVTAINQTFNVDIRSAVIFSHPSVRKLARFLSLQETTLNLSTKLNATTDKINLFMIHPGMSGTEVYLSLAKRLASDYSCYGLDNYNLNHKLKITDLTELAQVYLSEIDRTRQETKQTDQPYLLSGWSIGGLISLKIASLLEERGHSAVQVILFDTFLLDDKLLAVLHYDFPALHGFLRKMGHSEDHIQKIISNIDCENQVIQQSLHIGQLNTTKILLFKAMKSYDIGILVGYTAETDVYLTGLPYNNLEIISDPGNVTVVKFHNVNRSCVCQEEDSIFAKLKE
jgi:acyl carrier protein